MPSCTVSIECKYCGTPFTSRLDGLVSGHTKSCGCFEIKSFKMRMILVGRSNKKHGHHCNGKPSREYKTWNSMKNRCLNPKDPSYVRYGGRGICIVKRWIDSFSLFFKDMGKTSFKYEFRSN